MSMLIRPATGPDYAQIAAIATAAESEPVDGAELRERDQELQKLPHLRLIRLVAEVENGRVAGYVVASHSTESPEPSWYARVLVAPALRGQGVGLRLYEELEQAIRTQGGTKISTRCLGGDEESFRWAERRGFVLERERTESVLDLASWDGSRFAGHLERVEATGLRFVTLNAIPESLMKAVWETEVETTLDHPEYQPGQELISYEAFCRARSMDNKGQVWALALDGDVVAGYSVIALPTQPGEGAYTEYTCVRRAYRGRGLALAVKLLTIESARAHGAPHMRTNNNFENGPMLRVNEKLGYHMVPGPKVLIKTL